MGPLDQISARLNSGKPDLIAMHGDPEGDVLKIFYEWGRGQYDERAVLANDSHSDNRECDHQHLSCDRGTHRALESQYPITTARANKGELLDVQTQQFEFGQRTYIALKFKTGQLVKKPWGESVRYTLVNGKSAFFPVDVNESIKALNLSPRESFSVTRRRENEKVVWDIERETVSRNGNGPITSPEAQPGRSDVRDAYLFDPTVSSSCPEPIRKPVAVATAPTALLNTEQSRHIMRQLVAAIDVAACAEKYALTALGRTIEFSHEDIRALAISGFIEQSRSAA